MDEEAIPKEDAVFLQAVGRLGPELIGVLGALEAAARRLHPPDLPGLREVLRPVADRFDRVFEEWAQFPAPPHLEGMAEVLGDAGKRVSRALELFLGDSAENREAGIISVLSAFREHCRAQAGLFPLRRFFPALDRHFIEAGAEEKLSVLASESTPRTDVGIFNAQNQPEDRGGFSLFVPDNYDPARSWPLVMALHGGFGHGGDFLWTWLREARSRGWLLLAPTSRATTWSLMGQDLDAAGLDSMLDYVDDRWSVDRDRMLLTGLSDGGTYTLLYGLAEGSRFTALAPIAGVLHPANLVNGNLERARGARIRLTHGALDWMFPVDTARAATTTLREAGALVKYREIPDLSHAYPREENAEILEWAGSQMGVAGLD